MYVLVSYDSNFGERWLSAYGVDLAEIRSIMDDEIADELEERDHCEVWRSEDGMQAAIHDFEEIYVSWAIVFMIHGEAVEIDMPTDFSVIEDEVFANVED